VARVDFDPLRWAVPLHGAHGLIGALLLGEKRDGALFTQEEIEIAQASAEQIVDTLAGEEISRRLLALQRRRLAETQVLDHRTRRELHDVILPDLHTAILDLSAAEFNREGIIASLSALHDRISRLIHVHPAAYFAANGEEDFVAEVRRMIASEFAHEFTTVHWQGDATTPPLEGLVAEVGFYAMREALRNAAIHGRGANNRHPLNLTITISCADELRAIVQDDGVGWAKDSTHEVKQGGLLLHQTLLAAVGGGLIVESGPGVGTIVTIDLPLYTRT
jgi:signal transduction histidine kinase